MLVTERKPIEEILGYLEGERRIFLVGCNGCAEACHTGGETQVLEMKQILEKQGKKIMGYIVVDFLCDKALVNLRLRAFNREISESDSLLVMTCGIGVQATSAEVAKIVHPACNTLNMGGVHGEWRGSERCLECGDCLLDMTGGICPLTACTKGLLNGPCGGTRDGKCEVEPEVRDCGWHLIYERLKELNRLDKMRNLAAVKDYSRMMPRRELRSTVMWALEQEEKEVVPK